MGFVVVKVFLVAVIGYLLGSVNTSIIIGKLYRVDIRQHGSGNAGATNTLRTLGKTAAIFATFGDMLKGFIACLIGMVIIGYVENIGSIGLMVGGVTAIVGHNWPVYFNFKGGKGILTTFAVVLMMRWEIALILFGIFLIIVAVTRYVSLGSIISAILFPLVAFVFNESAVFMVLAMIVALLAVVRHRSNIERLFKGTESKLGAKKRANPKKE